MAMTSVIQLNRAGLITSELPKKPGRMMAASPWPYHNGRTLENMKRVVILGRGASGKSTLARLLGEITGLPVIELDKVFWQPGLAATPRDQWVVVQERLIAEPA